MARSKDFGDHAGGFRDGPAIHREHLDRVPHFVMVRGIEEKNAIAMAQTAYFSINTAFYSISPDFSLGFCCETESGDYAFLLHPNGSRVQFMASAWSRHQTGFGRCGKRGWFVHT